MGGGGLCTQADIDAATSSSDPCVNKTTSAPKGNSVKGSGSIRTLQGFATSGAAKMSTEKWWNVYKNYWDDDNYDNEASTVAGDSPHAWDEGWAFYAGSLEGTDGAGSGVMIHNLAESRCADFGTCANGRSGAATANEKHLAKARTGRDKILIRDCYTVTQEFDAIVDQMTVPLIQGMLKYAYKSDPKNTLGSCETAGDNCDKAWAEGWAFAAAVLPRLHYCSSDKNDVAKLVKDNLDVAITPGDQMKDGFAKLKTTVESIYDCLGVTCADIGEFQTTAGVYAGMEACKDPETPAPTSTDATTAEDEDDEDDDAADASGAVVAAFAMFLLNAEI